VPRAVITLVLARQEGHAAAFRWVAAGFLLMVAALVITLAVEVPIDNRIQTWTAATLPADWRSIQSRWELWHTVRTFASIAALAAVAIGAVVTGRPEEPQVREVGSPGGAVAGGRPA
jgi:uncharacterized membrane protein